jgi:hypothetical protein
MTSVALLLVSLTLLSAASCERHKPPKTELCIVGTADTFLCNDQRLDDNTQDYDLVYPDDVENYICTNPADYQQLNGYCTGLREKLIKCERELDKNRRKR